MRWRARRQLKPVLLLPRQPLRRHRHRLALPPQRRVQLLLPHLPLEAHLAPLLLAALLRLVVLPVVEYLALLVVRPVDSLAVRHHPVALLVEYLVPLVDSLVPVLRLVEPDLLARLAARYHPEVLPVVEYLALLVVRPVDFLAVRHHPVALLVVEYLVLLVVRPVDFQANLVPRLRPSQKHCSTRPNWHLKRDEIKTAFSI